MLKALNGKDIFIMEKDIQKQCHNAKQEKIKTKFAKQLLKELLFLLIEALFLLITFSILWANQYYGDLISCDEIIFHLMMPVVGTSDDIIASYFNYISITALPIFVLNLPLLYLCHKAKYDWNNFISKALLNIKRFVQKWSWITYIAWTICITFLLNSCFGFFDWVKAQTSNSTFIAEQYVDPNSIKIEFPEQKRNLIHIFVESTETTIQDKVNGGYLEENLIPELTELAKNNISFSQSDKLEGAATAPLCGWTVAALITQTSGIPLKLYGDSAALSHSMSLYESFLPGAKSIGEVLQDAGYKNFFMAGSDFDFGGGTKYLLEHGNYEIYDYKTAVVNGKIPEGYFEWWGFEDQKLFEYAKEELLKLAAADQPFNFTMMTCDSHSEDGYVCDLCQEYYDDQYSNVWRCTSKQVEDFVKWIQEQPFYENTTIVITGDHCSMDSDFYSDLPQEPHAGTTIRKTYNCFIHSAIEPKTENNRQFTTIDMYPTILASLGVKIDGNRLALGVNLFSDEQTLSEKFGYEYFFSELEKKSVFYNSELLYP